MATCCTSLPAQEDSNREIVPVDVSVHNSVDEHVQDPAPPLAPTKQVPMFSSWSLRGVAQPSANAAWPGPPVIFDPNTRSSDTAASPGKSLSAFNGPSVQPARQLPTATFWPAHNATAPSDDRNTYSLGEYPNLFGLSPVQHPDDSPKLHMPFKTPVPIAEAPSETQGFSMAFEGKQLGLANGASVPKVAFFQGRNQTKPIHPKSQPQKSADHSNAAATPNSLSPKKD